MGWKCVSVPEAKVYHSVGASNEQVLNGGEQRVSEKRYISGRANIMMVQAKHVHTVWLPAVALWWSGELVKKLAKRDGKLIRGAFRAGALVLKNAGELMEDRRRLSRLSPGLAPFFRDSTFNER
jgi:hypothetical protein